MDAKTKAEGEFKATGTATAASDSSRIHVHMRLTLPGERPIRMEMINIRDDFSMRSPAFDLPRGKHWMHSVDLIRAPGDVEESGASACAVARRRTTGRR